MDITEASISTTSTTGSLPTPSEDPEPEPSICFCRALYDYPTKDPANLPLRKHVIYQVLHRLSSGWWDGLRMSDERRGWFPSNYVVVIPPYQVPEAEMIYKDPKKSARQNTPVDESDSQPRQPLPSEPEISQLELLSGSDRELNHTGVTDPENIVSALLALDARSILRYGKTEAVTKMADDLYEALRSNRINDRELAFKGYRLLTKLVLASRRVPRSIILHNVMRARNPEGKLLDMLFEGGFGDIYQGTYNDQLVAIKRIRPLMGKLDDREREILILCNLEHPLIVPFLGVAYDVEGLGESPCIVFPWYDNGTLEHYLRDNPIYRALTWTWVLELVEGLTYLYTMQVPVIHGDLRAGNIMVDDDLCIRIADFGLSRISQETQTMTMTNGSGTTYWKAPEMIDDEQEGSDEGANSEADTIISHKSKATDVWALGCTINEMYEGKYPFHWLSKNPSRRPSDFSVLKALTSRKLPAVARPEQPQAFTTMPEGLWLLVLRCWAQSPAERPDVAEIGARFAEMS